MPKSNDRLGYLDAIRGLMILWMLLVHCSLTSGFNIWAKPYSVTSPFLWMNFFMVPFYFFSGYLFNEKGSVLDCLKNKAKGLLLPYLYFSLFGLLVFEAYNLYASRALNFSVVNAFKHTACLSSNTPCWFFISLFVIVCVFRCIYSLFAHRFSKQVVVLFLACVSLSIAYISCNSVQILGHGNISLGLFYYCCGYLFKRNETKFDKIAVFIIAFFACVLIGLLNRPQLSFVLNVLSQGNYFLCVIYSLCATFILWYMFRRLNKIKPLQYIGENSLFIFAAHRPILNWIIHPVTTKVARGGGEMFIDFAILLLVMLIMVECSRRFFKAV